MKIFTLVITLFGLFAVSVKAQETEQRAPQHREKAPVNQVDSRGQKHGMWWIAVSPRMGEPGLTEFGNFDHGVKYGVWYKLDTEGDLVAIESFRNNVLDGEVKYYDRGRLYCTGHYRGLNPKNKFDTIMVMDPITHLESYRMVATDQGSMRHGTFRYFNPVNGHLIKEEEYQVDELVYKKEYEVSAASDSILIKQHELRMPHKKGSYYTPPPGKRVSYTE